SGGYFKVPDWVIDSGSLTTYELAVLITLLRRADKNGRSFPSLARIRKDSGGMSENTVRKAIRGLINKCLILKVSVIPGGKTTYQVSHDIQRTINIADERYRNKKKKANRLTPSPDEGVSPSRNESIPPHQMRTKEYPKKETETNKVSDSFYKEDKENLNFDSKTQNRSVREKEDAESCTPSRDISVSDSSTPELKNGIPPIPMPSSNEPSAHGLLTRQAIDRLKRQPTGEVPDLSDIYAKFDELKKQTQERSQL
ncbi:MAG: helix-turn-helix domain-containing protein, partial [Thermodesulfobacteriota bacterium]